MTTNVPPGMLLTTEEREKLIEECKINLLDWMFGDGQEEGYIMDGFPTFKGLANMTDSELLAEYGHFLPEDDTPEKRVARLRLEWSEP